MTDYFRNPMYNMDAAQAIFAEFRGIDQVPKDCRGICGSRNVCGALYAACWIRPDLEDILLQEFEVYAGDVYCPEILQKRKLSCQQCVKLAEETLVDYLETKKEAPQFEWWTHME